MTLCLQFQGCGQSSAYALYLPTADIDAWRENKEYEAKFSRHNSVIESTAVLPFPSPREAAVSAQMRTNSLCETIKKDGADLVMGPQG